MLNKKFMYVLLASTFVLALLVFTLVLKPKPAGKLVDAPPVSEVITEEDNKVSISSLQAQAALADSQAVKTVKEAESVATLSQSLQDVKDGKKSILSVIFSNEDLNQELNDLLALSESGEAWADYAIGQLTEMCTYLYETPESSLIAMFSETRTNASPEQQAQMSELLPVIVNASQRCKTLDADQIKALGNSRDWFDKAAEAKDPNAYIISGYSLVNARLRSENEALASAKGEDRQKIRRAITAQASQEFRTQVHDFIVQGNANPETLMSMAEHLNLFYEDGHPYKSKEAWMLLACEQGYENNCSNSSTAMSVFCMFDSLCQTGGNFQEGVLWAQGQYKLDEHQRVADELKLVFENKDWHKLGF